MYMYKTEDLLNLNASIAGKELSMLEYPWQILPELKNIVLELQKNLGKDYVEVSPQVFVHKSAIVAKTACIMPPCIIGAGSEVRHGAFIRGSVLVGENCVVGNSTEVKNAIFFNNAKAPHFNYVGDSILGEGAHLGAGVICSNVKGDKSPISVTVGTEKLPTNLKKFGAIVGDNAEVGCNSVLNPGSVLGRNCQVYPLSFVRGFVPANMIVKQNGSQVKRETR